MLIAVDTNVLLDEEAGDEDVLDALSTIRDRIKGATFVVTPTVLHELALAAEEGDTVEKQKTAASALGNMLVRGYEPLNLIPACHGIAERIILRLLRDRGRLLPPRKRNVISEETIEE